MTTPRELTQNEQMIAARSAASGSAPSAQPPAESAGGITAWQGDKRVTALWGITENRNSWVYIAGVGWKRLANNSDSALVALTILSAHAREYNRRYDYRDEADGMIHEIYLW